MQASRNSTDSTSRVTRTIGFWLGLVLFFGLLLMPPPISMHNAARECFTKDIPEDIAAILEARGLPDAVRDSDAYRQAEVAALVACWWTSVAIPVPATSLLR